MRIHMISRRIVSRRRYHAKGGEYPWHIHGDYRNNWRFSARTYTFTGFFPPVQNSPILNGVKAGSSIPIKFSLNGDQGLNIIAEGYPTSQPVNCANVGTLQDMLQTVSP